MQCKKYILSTCHSFYICQASGPNGVRPDQSASNSFKKYIAKNRLDNIYAKNIYYKK